MRILHVISGLDPRGGGPAISTTGLTAAQARAGLTISLAVSWRGDDTPELVESVRKQAIKVEMIGPCRGKLMRHPQLAPTLRRMVGEADVVHIHGLWEEIQHQAARAAQRSGTPYLITPHGMLDRWSLAQSKWKKRLYMAWRLNRNLRRAAACHLTSAVEKETIQRLLPGVGVIVEPWGVDASECANVARSGSFLKEHGVTAQRRYVVFLGRIHPGKGLELLVPALAAADVPDVALVIAGPNSNGYRAYIDRLVRECGLADRTLFTGMLRGEERWKALVDADLLALPSQHENFGMVVPEALACGTPVILSDQVNIWREIVDGQVGGVAPLEVAAQAAELRRWLTDEALRQSAAARAREFVRDNYDWQHIAQRWREHYRRVLDAGRPGLPC